jgi:hypothetical protein
LITIQVKQSVFINLPAETIFAYLGELANLRNWSSVISVGELPTTTQVGATVQSTIRFLGNWHDMTFEVIEYEPSYSLTIKSTSGIAPCLFWFQLEPIAGGGTTVTQDAVVDLIEDYAEQTRPLIACAVRRQLEYNLLTLKDILEIRASCAANVV